jgi:GR25 family glycosyltransferase involved in LPS biosynthesis
MKFLIVILIVLFLSLLWFHISSNGSKKNYKLRKTYSYDLYDTFFTKYLKLEENYLNNKDIFELKPIKIPMYYINLDRCKSRNNHIKKQITNYNLKDITRIPGIDYKNLNNINTGTINMNNNIFNYINHYDNITIKELACTLSHTKAIYTAYMNNLDKVLILEDDASFVLYPYWPTTLEEIIDKAPEDWTTINLYNFQVQHDNTCFKTCDAKNVCYTGLAYIINRKGMKNILNEMLNENIIFISKCVDNIPIGVADVYLYLKGSKPYVYIENSLFVPYNNLNDMNSTIHIDHTDSHLTNSTSVIDFMRGVNCKNGYRLGDIVLHCNAYKNDKEIVTNLIRNPVSIGSQYKSLTDKENDIDILEIIVNNIINRHLYFFSKYINNDTINIHLRTGDVIDDNTKSVDDILNSQTTYNGGHIYTRPINFYKNILEKNPNLKNIKNILLFTGFHKNRDNSKSLKYIESIKIFFEKNGFTVNTRINEDPDDDFIILSKSTYFIPSGGGYTRLISEMVKRNGGKVYE